MRARANTYTHNTHKRTSSTTHTHITQKTGTKYDVTSCKTNQKKHKEFRTAHKKYLQQYRKNKQTNTHKNRYNQPNNTYINPPAKVAVLVWSVRKTKYTRFLTRLGRFLQPITTLRWTPHSYEHPEGSGEL